MSGAAQEKLTLRLPPPSGRMLAFDKRCGWVWAITWSPIDLRVFAHIASASTCPRCGNHAKDDILMAGPAQLELYAEILRTELAAVEAEIAAGPEG